MTATHSPWWRLATGLVVLLSSYVGVRTRASDHVDTLVERTVTARHARSVDRAVGVATDLGSIHALGGLVSVLAATGRRATAFEVAASGTAAWILAQVVKPAARRRRPYQAGRLDLLVSPPADSSWPSGHAALAAAAATALWPQLGPVGRFTAGAAVTGVGVSRIYVGVHHASDVVAGAGVGIAAAGIAVGLRGRLPARHAGRAGRCVS